MLYSLLEYGTYSIMPYHDFEKKNAYIIVSLARFKNILRSFAILLCNAPGTL